MMNVKDSEILDWIAQGRDNDALSALYKNSLPKIKKFIMMNNGSEEVVKDVFQDTIVAFYRTVKTGKFQEGKSIDAFLFFIAKNRYINYINRYVNRTVKLPDREILSETATTLDVIMSKEKEEHILLVFKELGSRCEELLKLSVFHSFNMKEMSARMGYANEDVTKAKLYKCRQRLSVLVKNNEVLLQLFRS